MPDLGSNLTELGIYVQRVSEKTSIPTAQVEKDFWITEALRAVLEVAADRGVGLIFKGGTSLSKGFKMISRFSEDVDLIVVFPEGMSNTTRHNVFRTMAGAAGDALFCEPIVNDAASERGVKRPVTLPYPSALGLGAAGIRNEGLYLELGSRGGTQPISAREIRSLVAEHAAEVDLPNDFDEVLPFSIQTLDPARTLIEKLLILHNAAIEGDDARKRVTARHFYDIHCLLDNAAVRESVLSVGANAVAIDVAEHSAMAGLAQIHIPDGGFPNSPAFDHDANPEARQEYEEVVLRLLLWPDAEQPSFEDCCQKVKEHKSILAW